MNKKDEALKLALEALKSVADHRPNDETNAAITAIREALAESALERMAENERELGLDYMEPAIKQDLTPEQPAQDEHQAHYKQVVDGVREAFDSKRKQQPAQQGCMRCNTPKKCALYGCSPLTWPAEQPAQQHDIPKIGCVNHDCDKCKAQQQQQEPVAWMIWTHGPVRVFMNKDEASMEFDRLNHAYPEPTRMLVPLYTSPPASKPLTDEQIKRLKPLSADFVSFRAGVRCMEREYGIGAKR